MSDKSESFTLGVGQRPAPGVWGLLSLQHLFAMFGATVLVPLLVGLPPEVALVTSGVGTLIYLLCTGGQVPAASTVPEIAFDSVPDPLSLPKDLHLGEVAGIAVDSKRNVYVLSRGNTTGPAYGAAAAQLLEFDARGRFLREIGHNLYGWSYAHSVRIDRHDNMLRVRRNTERRDIRPSRTRLCRDRCRARRRRRADASSEAAAASTS